MRGLDILRCASDFQDEERVYALECDCATIYCRLANIITIRFILDNEERYSVTFFAPELDSFCVFTAVFLYMFTSATAMRILRFRSMVRLFTISAIQVMSMAIEIKTDGCFAARFSCFFSYVLDCIAQAKGGAGFAFRIDAFNFRRFRRRMSIAMANDFQAGR